MTAIAERPRTVTAETDHDHDDVEVYCPDAEAWSRIRHCFCETCGATDHDLR